MMRLGVLIYKQHLVTERRLQAGIKGFRASENDIIFNSGIGKVPCLGSNRCATVEKLRNVVERLLLCLHAS